MMENVRGLAKCGKKALTGSYWEEGSVSVSGIKTPAGYSRWSLSAETL